MSKVGLITVDNGQIIGDIEISDEEAIGIPEIAGEALSSAGRDFDGGTQDGEAGVQSPMSPHHHGGRHVRSGSGHERGGHTGHDGHPHEPHHTTPHDPARPLEHPRIKARKHTPEPETKPEGKPKEKPEDQKKSFEEAAQPGEGAFDTKDDTKAAQPDKPTTGPTLKGSAYLKGERKSRADEVNKNSALKNEVLGMLRKESGESFNGMVATAEAFLNRSKMVGNTADEELHSGFYSTVKNGLAKAAGGPGGTAEEAWNAATGGSNLTQGRTDQGMVGDPNWQGPGRVPVPGTNEIYNFWKGSRRGKDFSYENARRFAEEQQRRVAEGGTVDIPYSTAESKVLPELIPGQAERRSRMPHPVTQAGSGNFSVAPGREGQIADVNPVLRETVAAAASHLPPGYKVEAFSGYSPTHGGAGSMHRRHLAMDVTIYDPQGHAIRNRGEDTTGMYGILAKHFMGEAQARGLGHMAEWGGRFGTSSQNPEEPDLMHFDFGGKRGHLSGPVEVGVPGHVYGKGAGATSTAGK